MHRVVITGLGTVNALGDTPRRTFAACIARRSGVHRAPDLAVSGAIPLVASAAFDAERVVPRRRCAPLDRATAMALFVAGEAIADSGEGFSPSTPETGVFWGTGMGSAQTIEDGYRSVFRNNDWRLKPTSIVTGMNNAAAAIISLEHGITGPTLTYSVACASSAVAIGEAARAIRHGDIDCAIAGGSEALLTPGIVSAWTALRTLAHEDPEDPARSCKPFSAGRTGFVLGEGAAALVLESMEHADERGAQVYAELAGYGLASDAAHIADPSAEGQARAMCAALRDAGIAPADVAYINAHGTATVVGDRVESESIMHAFGAHAPAIPVSSTKALHGHVMGATGAIEFMIALLALQTGSVPPTAHLDAADRSLGLDFVPEGPRHGLDLAAVVSNSFAFGGTNAVLVARRADSRRTRPPE
jgi:3-oxoacyl-[acyl-carrier-protein] synthase II